MMANGQLKERSDRSCTAQTLCHAYRTLSPCFPRSSLASPPPNLPSPPFSRCDCFLPRPCHQERFAGEDDRTPAPELAHLRTLRTRKFSLSLPPPPLVSTSTAKIWSWGGVRVPSSLDIEEGKGRGGKIKSVGKPPLGKMGTDYREHLHLLGWAVAECTVLVAKTGRNIKSGSIPSKHVSLR